MRRALLWRVLFKKALPLLATADVVTWGALFLGAPQTERALEVGADQRCNW